MYWEEAPLATFSNSSRSRKPPQTQPSGQTAAEYGGVMARIRQRAAALPASGQKVTDFIEADPMAFIQTPIAELASRIGVSTATINRTTRALGYARLRDLKFSLVVDAGKFEPMVESRITGDDHAIDIARSVFESTAAALNESVVGLDNAVLEEVAAALLAANRIEFFGAGISVLVASDAHFRLSRLGLPSAISADAYMQLSAAARLGPGDMAFAVSTYGRTISVNNALEAAASRGATTVLLTGVRQSPAARIADHVIVTATIETASGTEPTITRLAELTMVDALAAICALRRPDLLEHLHQGPRIYRPLRMVPE